MYDRYSQNWYRPIPNIRPKWPNTSAEYSADNSWKFPWIWSKICQKFHVNSTKIFLAAITVNLWVVNNTYNLIAKLEQNYHNSFNEKIDFLRQISAKMSVFRPFFYYRLFGHLGRIFGIGRILSAYKFVWINFTNFFSIFLFLPHCVPKRLFPV